jgi:Tfp pilus assembly pilus retraction ATPase PilT
MTVPAPTGPVSAAAPAVQSVNLRALLEEMIERDASDLHITAGERPKLRIDGDITNSQIEYVMTPKDTLMLAYSVLTENQKKRFELEDELDFSFGIQNLARFRGNCFKQRGCVSMVIRQIPFSVKTFQDLGLPAIIAKLAEKPRGLVLVTGPTGSGKSTTLAAMIDTSNRERKGHIITVEDPIEFIHRHQGCIVNQREVGTDTKSFGNALKYALREDPDVILIVTPAIRALIRDDKVHQIYSLMQSGKKYGMQTLNDALYNLYMGREVDLEECLRVSGDPNEFLRMVGQPTLEEPLDGKGAAAPPRMAPGGGRR